MMREADQVTGAADDLNPARRPGGTADGRPARRRAQRAAQLVLLAGIGLLTSACALRDDGLPQNALDPEGPVARQIDRLVSPVFAVAAFVFVLVEGLILYAIFKFRARSDDEAPVQVHGNARAELTWTVIPAAALAVIGFLTVITIFDVHDQAEGSDSLKVKVTGHQWWWEYEYPDFGVVTANELHIPAGRRVLIELTSADVIHNFWPPKLAGKIYAIPGRINHMEIEADDPGVYEGQCAEYCGLSHANMRLRVVAHDSRAFDAWVADQKRTAASPEQLEATNPRAAEGAQVFQQRGCGGCHTIAGFEGANGRVGPNLTHFKDRKVFAGAIFDVNDRNLRKWLRDPPAEKPMDPTNNQGMPNLGLTDEDIGKLIDYLNTLD